MKPTSKSKRQLAQLLIEAGVTQFPEGANWAAQDKVGTVCIYAVKPVRDVGDDCWSYKDGKVCSMYRYYAACSIPNWHQTVLSRDEFGQIVAETEPQYCESVMRTIPEPVSTPTLDQLLQDWRNADDYAQRKQTEADEAAAMRDERWQAAQARASEMGVMIDHATEERSDAVLQITKRSQLELGDVIWIGKSGVKEDERRLPEGEYQVVKVGTIGVLHNGVTFYPDFSFRSWRFIRRP